MKLAHRIRSLVDRRYSKVVHPIRAYHEALAGKIGLEVGGPSKIFTDKGSLPLYQAIDSLDGCNYSSKTVWEGEIVEGLSYNYYPGKKGFQHISEASDLSSIENEKYDFLISSHCLEHCANPIKTLMTWRRVVKKEGFLVVVLPHKKGTFDHERPTTALQHMIEDYDSTMGEDDLSHLEEILSLHDYSRDKASKDHEFFKLRSLRNIENRCLHHHVFDPLSAANLYNYLGFRIIRCDVKLPYHIIFLLGKTEGFVDNTAFLNPNYYSKISPLKD